MMVLLWQGSEEQVWRLGDVERPSSNKGRHCYVQHLDFLWTGHDDIRRIASSDHHQKVSICGTEDEVNRLGLLLVDFLNSHRLPGQMPKPDQPQTASPMVGE